MSILQTETNVLKKMIFEKHSEKTMTWMLVNRFKYDISRHIMVPNASWGMKLAWEADLLIISQAFYLSEIEIKISKSDLLADADKYKFELMESSGSPESKMIRHFYYAVPESLVQHFPDSYKERAGLISVPMHTTGVCTIIHESPVNSKAEKISPEMRDKALRLLGFRYWAQIDKAIFGESDSFDLESQMRRFLAAIKDESHRTIVRSEFESFIERRNLIENGI